MDVSSWRKYVLYVTFSHHHYYAKHASSFNMLCASKNAHTAYTSIDISCATAKIQCYTYTQLL